MNLRATLDPPTGSEVRRQLIAQRSGRINAGQPETVVFIGFRNDTGAILLTLNFGGGTFYRTLAAGGRRAT
jgi:hypothetical protein